MRIAILLLIVGQAFGAITVIGKAKGDPSNGLPVINTTGGNLILCTVSSDTNNALCFDNQNIPVYTLIGCSANGGGQFVCMSYLYNFPTPGSTTFNATATTQSLYVQVVAGAKDPGLATIQTATNSGSGGLAVSLTPACTNSLVIAGLHADGGLATVSGLTLDNSQATFSGVWGGAAASTIQTTATAVTATWSSITGPNSTVIAAILATTSSCGGGTTWGTWDGATVGASSGNLSKWNGVTIGTSAGNIITWNGLTR